MLYTGLCCFSRKSYIKFALSHRHLWFLSFINSNKLYFDKHLNKDIYEINSILFHANLKALNLRPKMITVHKVLKCFGGHDRLRDCTGIKGSSVDCYCYDTNRLPKLNVFLLILSMWLCEEYFQLYLRCLQIMILLHKCTISVHLDTNIRKHLFGICTDFQHVCYV